MTLESEFRGDLVDVQEQARQVIDDLYELSEEERQKGCDDSTSFLLSIMTIAAIRANTYTLNSLIQGYSTGEPMGLEALVMALVGTGGPLTNPSLNEKLDVLIAAVRDLESAIRYPNG